MRIPSWLILVACLFVSAALAQSPSPPAPGSPYAGTWRTANDSLQLRIDHGGAVEAFQETGARAACSCNCSRARAVG